MWYVHTFLHRCVCVFFPKAPKMKFIFGEQFKSWTSFSKAKAWQKMFCHLSLEKSKRLLVVQLHAQSCKPFEDYNSDSEWLDLCQLVHHSSPWGENLVLLIGFYSHVNLNSVPELGPEKRQFILWEANRNTPFQHIVMTWLQWDPTVQSRQAPW